MQQQIIDILEKVDIDVEEALRRFNYNEKLYKKCLGSFMQEQTYLTLIEAIDKGNYENAKKEAHTLKGICSNLGISVLTKACADVLVELRNDTGVLDAEKVDHLKETYDMVNLAIRECVELIRAVE